MKTQHLLPCFILFNAYANINEAITTKVWLKAGWDFSRRSANIESILKESWDNGLVLFSMSIYIYILILQLQLREVHIDWLL